MENAAVRRGGIVSWLKDRCATIREIVAQRSLATPEELAAYAPGGAENPERNQYAWCIYYANLVGFLRRAETPARDAPATGGAMDPSVEGAVLDALRGRPETVTLTTAAPDGAPRSVAVHPKSLDALLVLAGRDVTLRYLRHHLAALRDDAERVSSAPDPAALALIPRVLAEIGYQSKLACWCVTTPGSWLPFDPYADPRPVLPAELDSLSPLDVVLILRAHIAVNAGNVRALQTLCDDEDGADGRGERASWGVFLGSAAVALNVKSEELLRDWSLAGVLASHRAHAKAHRDATARAERDAAHGGHGARSRGGPQGVVGMATDDGDQSAGEDAA